MMLCVGLNPDGPDVGKPHEEISMTRDIILHTEIISYFFCIYVQNCFIKISLLSVE